VPLATLVVKAFKDHKVHRELLRLVQLEYLE
jgi:hypothetical protein